MGQSIPLLIQFAPGSLFLREIPAENEAAWDPAAAQAHVVLPDGRRLPLPECQVVYERGSPDGASVGLGGMSFEGVEKGRLVFWRVRDLTDATPAPDKLELDARAVVRVDVQGAQAWPNPARA
jgi:hypothetical protein